MSFFVWIGMFFLNFTTHIMWDNTEIVVPLHGDFISAINEVEAKLYIDNIFIVNTPP